MSRPNYPQQLGPVGQSPAYEDAPAPPTGYGGSGGMPPPPPGSEAPPQQPLERPTTVSYAIYALVANLMIGLISSVLGFANRNANIEQALRDAGLDPSSTSAVSSAETVFTVAVALVIGLGFVALWALFIWFAWKGRDWARIAIWVLGGISLFSAFGAFSSPVGSVVALTVVSLLLTLTAVVLLALKPSNDWYRYQGDARKYNWPGRA